MKKKKGSWIGYVAPYLLILVIVVAITLLFNNNSYGSSQHSDVAWGEIIVTHRDADGNEVNDYEKSFLWNQKIESLQVTRYNEGKLTVAGYYLTNDAQNREIRYSFTSSGLLTEANLSYIDTIVKTRTTDSGTLYYTNQNYAIINAYESNGFMDWLPTIIFFVLGIGAIIFIFSRLNASVNRSNNTALDFNKSRARREEVTNVHFDDVAGCDEEKAEMIELVDYLRNPGKYSKFGAKLPKGVLLVGPPGTGKTLLAKAVAGEARVPFYSISGSDFVEMFVGVGAGRVRDMFKKAKQNTPCLIFIDEIDAVGRQRGAGMGGGNDEREQTLNQLLVEMDGFSDNLGIIVIAATNREDVLDPALLRAGRFDRQITVNLPDKQGREEILKVHARNKTISPTVNFKAIAERTVGYSGADLANVLNEAAILAVRENKKEISTKEIDEAIDRQFAGPAKKSKKMSERERQIDAYHEAGHAIIGLKLDGSDVVRKVTIIPRGNTGGHVLMTPQDDYFLMTKTQLLAKIAGLLGGRSSEEIFFSDITTGAHQDIESATRIARLMVTQYGMSSLGPIQYERDQGSVFLGRDYNNTQKNFSNQVAFEVDQEVRKIIDEAHEKALEIIRKYKEDVELIAKALLEKETLNAEDISYLIENRHLPLDETEQETKVEPIETSKEPVQEEPKEESSGENKN